MLKITSRHRFNQIFTRHWSAIAARGASCLTHVSRHHDYSLNMPKLPFVLIAAVISAMTLLGACGGDDDGGGTPSSSASAGSSTPTGTPSDQIAPPLEGPDRGPAATERTDFRESEEWKLPSPDGVLPVPDDKKDAIYHPPSEPECAADWQSLVRPSEGFSICYPSDWQTAGYGYVTAGQEDRWFSVGLVKFTNDKRDEQDAHVSVYVIPRYARPMTYTRDCPLPYNLTFAGSPAVICPEFPGQGSEKYIVSYHIRRGDLDYFVQVVPYDGGSSDALDTAVEIAHTFKLIDVQTPQPTEAPAP